MVGNGRRSHVVCVTTSVEKRWGPRRDLRHLADEIIDVKFINGG